VLFGVPVHNIFEYNNTVLTLTLLEMYNPTNKSWFKSNLLGLGATAKMEYFLPMKE
jgi:hypothetical protein